MSCRCRSRTFDDWSDALGAAHDGSHCSGVEKAQSTDTRPDGTSDASSGRGGGQQRKRWGDKQYLQCLFSGLQAVLVHR